MKITSGYQYTGTLVLLNKNDIIVISDFIVKLPILYYVESARINVATLSACHLTLEIRVGLTASMTGRLFRSAADTDGLVDTLRRCGLGGRWFQG